MTFFERKDADGVWLNCDVFEPTPQGVEKLYDHLAGEQAELFDRIRAQLVCPKEYITKHAAEYGWNEYLLNEAKFYTPAILPRPIPYYQPNWRCYETSFAHAEKYGLRYVEGLAVYPAGAMIHAWCSSDGNDVIDYTWPYQHVNKYFGIEFELSWLKEKGYPHGGILGYLEDQTRKKSAEKVA